MLLKNVGEFEAAILSHVKNLPNVLKTNLSNYLPQWILAAVGGSFYSVFSFTFDKTDKAIFIGLILSYRIFVINPP